MLHSSFDDLLFYKKKTPYGSVLCTDLIKCGWISISLFQLWGQHYRSHTRGERWRQAGRNSSSNRETLSGSNSGLLSWNIICTPPHIPLLIINFGGRMATRNMTENCPMMCYVRCIALIYVNIIMNRPGLLQTPGMCNCAGTKTPRSQPRCRRLSSQWVSTGSQRVWATSHGASVGPHTVLLIAPQVLL